MPGNGAGVRRVWQALASARQRACKLCPASAGRKQRCQAHQAGAFVGLGIKKARKIVLPRPNPDSGDNETRRKRQTSQGKEGQSVVETNITGIMFGLG
jgi:hypothetical protein